MEFQSPLFVILPRKTKEDRKIQLNLNTYRNLHYLTNNRIKVLYCELMEEQLEGKVFKTPISIQFQLHKASKRKTDRANILSIVEKFFCDALVHYRCIPDDDDTFIISSHYTSGEIDRENPRAQIYIKENV